MDREIEEREKATFLELVGMLQKKVDPALLNVASGNIINFFGSVGAGSKPVTDVNGRLLRWQDKVIEQEIPVGSSVLDLGCGNGELLARLRDMKEVNGQGIERDPQAVMECVRTGVPVFQSDIASGLNSFADSSFDYVVLEETLQTLMNPTEVLSDMLRVGRRGIVSFPNFAFWQVRLDLALRGRMPQTGWLPYNWYDTPNIHCLSIQDFLTWIHKAGIVLISGYVLNEGKVRKLGISDNLYAEEVLMIVEKTRGERE